MMSYRDPETPSKKSTHHRQFSYDADEEDHFDFNPDDFILPDGTQPLDPAAIQRIEDATRMLRELEVNKEMHDMVGASPGGGSSASNKENEEPETLLKGDDVDYDGDDDDMVFGKTTTRKGKRKEAVWSGADNNAMEEDAQTDDTLRMTPQPYISTPKRNRKELATSLEEANTEIWLLKSIIKDQKREIKELRQVIADQAAQAELMSGSKVQAKQGGKLGLFSEQKYPTFAMGIDDRDSPFYSRPSRHDPDETVEEDFKAKRPRKEKMPLLFKKMHMDQRKRKAAWAEDNGQEMQDFDRNTGRAKKVKHKGRPFQMDTTEMASYVKGDFGDALPDWSMLGAGVSDSKRDSGSSAQRQIKSSKKERYSTTSAAESKNTDFNTDDNSTSVNRMEILDRHFSEPKSNGVTDGKVDESENKGVVRERGVVDAGEEIDVHNWLPTVDIVKDRLASNRIKAEVERLNRNKEARQPREKQREELKAKKQLKVELEEMEE
ncbi:hypothetical protein BDZ45DRAFT_749259 [Acephala macrosclerotiorum]|nr:hypothetical protein BDZ45DRAFT_749259 [Acephala macrosclerotiorum]